MNIKKAILLLVLSGAAGNNIFATAEAGKESASKRNPSMDLEMVLNKINEVRRTVTALNIPESAKEKLMQVLDEHEDLAIGLEKASQRDKATIKRLQRKVTEIVERKRKN